MIQGLKTFLRETLSIPPWVILALSGLFIHLLTCLIIKKPVHSFWGLPPVILFGVAMESYEIWNHYKDIGLFAPGNDPLIQILLRHMMDIVIMLFFPVVVIISGKIFFD